MRVGGCCVSQTVGAVLIASIERRGSIGAY
jgi:hypothetical protein